MNDADHATREGLDCEALGALREWAIREGLPLSFVDKLPKLKTRDPEQIRVLMDELAELGYPFAANDLRRIWGTRSRD